MYSSTAFNVSDCDTLVAFMRTFDFVTLINDGDTPFVTHLPLLPDERRGPHGVLVVHFARPNPH